MIVCVVVMIDQWGMMGEGFGATTDALLLVTPIAYVALIVGFKRWQNRRPPPSNTVDAA